MLLVSPSKKKHKKSRLFEWKLKKVIMRLGKSTLQISKCWCHLCQSCLWVSLLKWLISVLTHGCHKRSSKATPLQCHATRQWLPPVFHMRTLIMHTQNQSSRHVSLPLVSLAWSMIRVSDTGVWQLHFSFPQYYTSSTFMAKNVVFV